MGPPPFGDGYVERTPRAAFNRHASMGPPPFGDGYACWDRWHGEIRHRFNGATAFRRWIRVNTVTLPRHSQPPSTCFNGATAFRRWIRSPSRYAQMRFVDCCFNGATAFRRWIQDQHYQDPSRRQVLPCFNGATAFRRWIRVGYAEDRPPRLHASMGPPPFGDGYAPDGPQRDLAGVASMGPPPFGDGYHAR